MWRTESTPAGTAWTLVLDTDGSNRVIGAVSSCSSNRGEIEIFDGVIDRDTVAFKCLSLNRARTLSFTGQVDQDQIHFTWEKTGPGGNPTDDALFGASAPSRFSVRRVVGATSDAEARLAEVVSRIRRSPAVTFDELINAARHPQNWLTYSGDLRGHRHSPLTQITRSNVSDLELAWLAQAPTNSEIQATPLVVDGVMYTTRNTNDVVALDAASGRVLWEFNYTPLPSARASGGGGRPNRGLAILGGTLFLATLDAHLVAIDAYSGKPIWDKTVADASDPSCKGGPSCYSMTLAPLVIKDKVLVGVGGGEGRTRGFLAAFDARTGSEVWRFHTIPAQGEFGNDTWSGDSWRTGGAPIWNTGGYDPELDLTYWGTGNPSPPFDGSARRGDNLYSNSVVALDATTGKLRWYFQFTPHDVNDWDSTQVPVLTDLVWQGTRRKVMLWANRNGLFYVLDRTTGEFLMGEPFVQVNWTSGLDAKGRPMRTPRRAGDAIRPSSATNWYPPSFSSRTGLFYVAAWERARTSEGPQLGKSFGAIRALNPSTGDTVWEFRLDDAVFWRGVMTTASDLLFTGTWGDFYSDPEDARRVDGYFYALDARTGTSLWKFALTGAIQSPPITYSVRGRQYVAVAARDTMFAFALR
jgi:alcohol dehydrogenase (cytochrome c)